MITKNSILIVGGTGFIGYHLAKKCLQKGWDVTSISTKLPRKKTYLSRAKYKICDITKKKNLKKKINKYFKYVVNLGGYVDHSNKKKTFESHYMGCKNLAEIFLKKKPDSFVQIGSCIEYGNTKSPQKENAKCNPKSVYGKAKLLSSLHLIDLFKKKKFPCTILRLYQVYGPKQDFNRFIPVIISSCIKNKKFSCSEGSQLRDFLYVDDVVEAILKSLQNKNAKGEIINIGSGNPRKIRKIIENINTTLRGGHPLFGKIKLRKDEMLKMYPNIKKSRNKINWIPKVSFNSGLKKTIKSYK